jgi:CO/xanthine dehydrogenase FAD-binding subunit
MDLIGVTAIREPRTRTEIALGPRDRPIGGGTWLYSEPQTGFDTIVDLTALGWPAVEETDDALTLAATARLREVHALRSREWAAAPLFGQCVEALLASWKVWNVATIGGNLCFGVPASAMVSLTTALDASLTIWGPDHDRVVPAADFVLGPRMLALRPGEVLRSIAFPRRALESRTAIRTIALADLGRSGVVVIGRRGPDGLAISVTAATARPHVLRDPREVDAIDDWHDDAHGDPDWREAMTRRFVAEVAEELS